MEDPLGNMNAWWEKGDFALARRLFHGVRGIISLSRTNEVESAKKYPGACLLLGGRLIDDDSCFVRRCISYYEQVVTVLIRFCLYKGTT